MPTYLVTLPSALGDEYRQDGDPSTGPLRIEAERVEKEEIGNFKHAFVFYGANGRVVTTFQQAVVIGIREIEIDP